MNFWPEEYDAGASPSTIKEARWRTTQHPACRFQIVFEFQGGCVFSILKGL
jgi:hypothetical protein